MENTPENSHKYFKNTACKYFPCHKNVNAKGFNCLFCYCPLYALGETCGGVFKYNQKNKKVCTDCPLPHQPDYYDIIVAKLR